MTVDAVPTPYVPMIEFLNWVLIGVSLRNALKSENQNDPEMKRHFEDIFHRMRTVSFRSQFFICLRSQVLLDSIFRFLSSSNFSRCRILLCSDPILSFMKSTSSMSDSSVSGVSLSDSIKRFSEINLDSISQMPIKSF